MAAAAAIGGGGESGGAGASGSFIFDVSPSSPSILAAAREAHGPLRELLAFGNATPAAAVAQPPPVQLLPRPAHLTLAALQAAAAAERRNSSAAEPAAMEGSGAEATTAAGAGPRAPSPGLYSVDNGGATPSQSGGGGSGCWQQDEWQQEADSGVAAGDRRGARRMRQQHIAFAPVLKPGPAAAAPAAAAAAAEKGLHEAQERKRDAQGKLKLTGVRVPGCTLEHACMQDCASCGCAANMPRFWRADTPCSWRRHVHCFGCFHEEDGMTCSAGAARERWAGRPTRDADGADGMDVDMSDAAPVRLWDFDRLCSVLHAVAKSSRETQTRQMAALVWEVCTGSTTRAGTSAELCRMWLHLPQLHHVHYGAREPGRGLRKRRAKLATELRAKGQQYVPPRDSQSIDGRKV